MSLILLTGSLELKFHLLKKLENHCSTVRTRGHNLTQGRLVWDLGLLNPGPVLTRLNTTAKQTQKSSPPLNEGLEPGDPALKGSLGRGVGERVEAGVGGIEALTPDLQWERSREI